ncbi:glycosyltransferase family 2 protein [Clostridioides sp. GD02377]|uniref:glycosyltransferase family 2 protein n=1 Tax=unclassified Clostridioides TaxID=2635829 RepID=UPI00389B741F
MKISVIIPTRNAERYLENLIKSLLNQTVNPDEIIIIDTESSDRTKQIAQQYDKIEFVQITQNEFGHGKTRNYAAKLATGDILVFITQDACPQNNGVMEELIKPLGKNNVVCTYGKQIPNKDSNIIEIFSRNFNYGDSDIIKSKEDIKRLNIKTFFFSNVCSAYIKEEFFRVGGFPEDVIMNEDMIIAAKFIFNDKKTYYASNAKVFHSHTYSYVQQFKRNFDIGVVFVDSSKYFFGIKAESEGIRFVKEALKYLVKNNKIWLIPNLIMESGFKFIGHLCGKNYKKLPKKLVKKMSMHSFYFDIKELSAVENKS